MKKFALQGINALGIPAKFACHVDHFADEKKYFSIREITSQSIRLVTPKGSYLMQKHPALNIYQATVAGHKAQVSLQKVVGWIGYW